MAKIKLETLIKYCAQMSESDTNPESDWKVQRRRYKVIGESLAAYDEMLKRDDRVAVKDAYMVGNSKCNGVCAKCRTELLSKYDFCPKCGRPIDWATALKNARRI